MLFDAQALAIIGASIALLGGLVGSSIGIGIAGSAGAATLSEDSSQFRNVILFASLPMTQSFYGLIVLILVLVSVMGKLEGVDIDPGAGAMVLGIGLMTGAAELFSAIYQGHVCASSISLLPKTRGKIMVNGIMLAVFVELLGLLGMVFAIMSFALLGLM